MNRRRFVAAAGGFAASAILSPRSFVGGAEPEAASAGPAAGRMPRIKIGQIGTGHAHASGKMEAVRALPELYEVVGIAEADDARRARAAKSSAYADLPWRSEAELLAMPGLQAVNIETEMADSCAAAARALAAGKHIHLDKPGAMQHDEFRAMRLDAERRGLTVQMGYMLRYNPAFELLFRAVREGWLGEVLEVDAMMGKLLSGGAREPIAALPGGGMFELACHVIDAVVTILGKPQRVVGFSTPTAAGPANMKDNQLAVFEYPRATAIVRCNMSDPFGSPRRRFQVTGTKGTLEIRPLESGQIRLMLEQPHGEYAKGDRTYELKVPKGRYTGEFFDLAKVVRGEKKLAWNAAHDIAVHEAVLKASGAWNE